MSKATKCCSRCGKHKTLDSFGVDRSRKDNLKVYCKQCVYARSQSKKGKAARARWVENGGRERVRAYAQTDAAKAKRNARLKEQRLKQRRDLVSSQVARAIKKGELRPASDWRCLGCYGPAQEYHHHNYNRPFEITAFCHTCHLKLHAHIRHANRGRAVFVARRNISERE